MKIFGFARLIGRVGIVGCAMVVAPGTAQALSCRTNWLQEPRDGATGVPTNTLIWAHGRFGQSNAARLIGPSGPVPVQERFIPVAIASGRATNYPILIPAEPLRPNTRYRIEVTHRRDPPDEDITESTSFRTGDGPKLDAPPLPSLVSKVAEAGPGWSVELNRWLTLELPHDGILIADNAGALGDVGSVSELLQPTPASFVSFDLSPSSRVVRWLSTDPELHVGLSDCLVWPEDNVERQEARFGVLDLAGNFSGWSEVTELVLPSDAEARVLADEAQAEREAQAELLRRADDKERLGLFEGHNCSVSGLAPVARGSAGLLIALFGVGLLWRARTRRAS
jgi:hypothetical protein